MPTALPSADPPANHGRSSKAYVLPTSATIRIYGYIPWAGSNATSLLFDNITIFGNVIQMPEPSTATFLLLPAAAGFARRRRKR